MKNAPRRYGIDHFGWETIGLALIICKGVYYETYDFERKVVYLDIRLTILFWSAFVQIPIKKYATKAELKVV